MRTVLVTAAAATLFLGFAAHGEVRGGAPMLRGSACIAGASTVSPTLAPASEAVDCCAANTHCSQYISTKALIRAPRRGRT